VRAISLWQPWASLVAIGAKRIETRHWSTTYRGPLAIHAAKKWSRDLELTAREHPFEAALRAGSAWPPADLPFGAIVAVCELHSCNEILGRSATDVSLMRFGGFPMVGGGYDVVTVDEEAFGDYEPGRFAWRLSHVRKLPKPIPFRGAQGFFDVPDDLIALGLAGMA
jgi:hypothetical protein